MADSVKIRMLGDFTIEYGGNSIDDNSNRSRKVWSLLAYLVQNRNRAIPQEELIDMLWGESEKDTDPRGALKALFYRIRTTLDKLGKAAGHSFIVSKGGTYSWSEDYPVETDTDAFEALIKQARITKDKDRALELYTQALDLYSGHFLSKMSMDSWVIPLDVYYSQLYMDTVLVTLSLMEEKELMESMVRVCKAALVQDPYNEEVYAYYMTAMLKLGNRKGVAEAYEEFRDQLYTMFSIQPSERLRELYREAMKTVNTSSVAPEIILEQLREQDFLKGALICEYDFFKVLYRSAARAIVRSGDVIHIAVFSLTGEGGSELAKRSLDRAMENLQDQIRISLRSGDSAARCSVSQFVIMLQQSNYENSCVVCERIVKAFYRQYPHSPAKLHYTVHPLVPMV